ncbi:hypothetical protein HELRODRAFT_161588 [Helobdella robusta]|uniref:Uncharacterized protein n=1 Tax=Helobdella robusta TaxID=6412 RepID=T1ERN7_HELRO|nr:hypothetical protein HELRODRAFT_161588 [Helobdella robusta]ESO02333.1 hypothetical protein HELRODRAFT_161588 [Helobdella robusta]
MNIIQYKESFCASSSNLKTVCSQIRVETQLHILVRDPAVPIQCPKRDAYYFEYKDMSTGYCGQAISYAKPCAGLTRVQFHFKHCNPLANLNKKEDARQRLPNDDNCSDKNKNNNKNNNIDDSNID